MKNHHLRSAALAVVAFVSLLASTGSAPAFVDVGINVGGPPPPPRPENRWAAPYRGAVWIGGHNEWRGGNWVWVGGYYDYPPRPGAVWIPGHYGRHLWHRGHWRY